jgi:mycothiol synthase
MNELQLRAYAGESDVPDIVRIENAENEADGVSERVSLSGMLAQYRHASEMFDPVRDVTLAVCDGRSVGYAMREWVDTSDGDLREYRLHGAVEPAYRRRGIGSALLADSERLARQLARGHRTERQRAFGSWSGDTQAGDIAVLRRHGYTPVRWFFEMLRPTLDDVPAVPMPDGLEVRPITRELVPAVWHADVEAFQDHWGGFDDSDAALRRWIARPTFDPGLWLVAFDGDQVAGGVINSIDREENAALGIERGWLNSVFTRRPWRKRGLARALIARSLDLLRERGMTSAGLGVDADNPTGALDLYEKLGFGVHERSTAWRKPMASDETAESDR